MKIPFYKYQGTGNDFILVDNRTGIYSELPVKQLCDRRFGIGADGLMLLELEEGFDFKMVYFNSDGNISSMCGNGGRCIVSLAKRLDLISSKAIFNAIDGRHEATIDVVNGVEIVNLQMSGVEKIEKVGEDYILNTGSPHYVHFLNAKEDLTSYPVFEKGQKIRQSLPFKSEGINVNFVKETADGIDVRTFERGVEDETLSCGTGVTACAIAAHFKNNNSDTAVNLETAIFTPGGNLKVTFNANNNNYNSILLGGPAEFVYSGTVEI